MSGKRVDVLTTPGGPRPPIQVMGTWYGWVGHNKPIKPWLWTPMPRCPWHFCQGHFSTVPDQSPESKPQAGSPRRHTTAMPTRV